MTITKRDRYLGTLVGVLAGDALGAPYEKSEPEEIAADIERRRGLVPFDYACPWGDGTFPAGRPTDDSELTAALAQSLLERKGCDPAHQYSLFRESVAGKSLLWDGTAVGFGGTTKKMLAPETYGRSQELAHNFARATNGSLMRSAPLSLFYNGWEEELLKATRISSRVTHVSEASIECCLVFVKVLDALLFGEKPFKALMFGSDVVDKYPEIWDFVKTEPVATNEWPPSGGALHTLHIALFAFNSASCFEEGITSAVLKGGDTDTAAAIAGALLGAHYGLSGIPAEWIGQLKGFDRMVELASLLYEERWGE